MRKKVKNMKNIIKISMLGAILASGVAFAGEKSIHDFLNDQKVSYLLVNSGETSRLTTFGWDTAEAVCEYVQNAGYTVKTVRNYDKVERVETFATCKK
jgi:hypothetical protein